MCIFKNTNMDKYQIKYKYSIFQKYLRNFKKRKINYLFLKGFEKYLPIAKVSAYPRIANLDAQYGAKP